MPFPVVLVAVAAGTAVANFVGNKLIENQAKKKVEDLQAHHDDEYAKHRAAADSTSAKLRTLGEHQKSALDTVMPRIKAFAERNERQLRMRERQIIEEGETPEKREIGALPDVSGPGEIAAAMNGVVSAAAGGGLSGAAYATVAKVATASTGTAIKTLSGVAAKNATLAAIGGGAKAAGGGGIAAGVLRLNIITAVPAVALSVGLMIKSKSDADKAVAKYDADVKEAVAKYNHRNELFRGIDERVGEIEEVLAGLVSCAGETIDRLEQAEREPGGFDLHNDDHAHRLQAALLVVKGVGEVGATPVVNPDLTLDPNGEFLMVKYRNYNPENPNG
ncbi:hypothetical protein DER29_3389 [Micromonospora sp. M71_S20]|uniref:hypothetical protein n=1 Tax=Micromonospora sp. M71_S20 TaxID=592872 RepID=UPI000EB2D8BB|nr:hypothetical protein [Micromonospora sp. M71_S20]RLK25387.1 hypothetical protein DER29_3389 [Micromonospora sp. M71_S20]